MDNLRLVISMEQPLLLLRGVGLVESNMLHTRTSRDTHKQGTEETEERKGRERKRELDPQVASFMMERQGTQGFALSTR